MYRIVFWGPGNIEKGTFSRALQHLQHSDFALRVEAHSLHVAVTEETNRGYICVSISSYYAVVLGGGVTRNPAQKALKLQVRSVHASNTPPGAPSLHIAPI